MADIIELGAPEGQTMLDLEPDKVLQGALKNNLKEVIIVGRNENDEFYLASSIGDTYRTYFWLDFAKVALRELSTE